MKLVALGAVAELNPPKPKGLQPEQTCSFVPMEAVDDILGVIASPVERLIGEVGQGYTYFANDDVLFAKITPCMENGKCAIARNLVNGIGFGSTEFHVARAHEDVIPEWIYYFLRQEKVRREAMRHMTGSAGQQRVPAAFLREVQIPLPPLAEQQRIAGLLRRADRLRRYALDVSAGYLQAVFVEMFGDPVRNPMGWPVVKLATAFSEKPQIGTPNPAHENGEHLIIRVGEIGKPGVDLDRCATITLKGAELRRYQALPGDLFLARAIGSAEHLGKASVLQRSTGRVVVYDSHVMRLRFKDKAVLPDFMLHWLRSQGGRALFMRKAGRTAVQFNVNTDQIADIDIPLPSLAVQKQFVTMVKQHERLNTQQNEALRQAEHLFQALLRRAFHTDLPPNYP